MSETNALLLTVLPLWLALCYAGYRYLWAPMNDEGDNTDDN